MTQEERLRKAFVAGVEWCSSLESIPCQWECKEEAARRYPDSPAPTPSPPIVCLCGSTRFLNEEREAYKQETFLGKIVLSHSGVRTENEITGGWLNELHKRKIDLCDEILILDIGGYIGDSTRSEIEYATRHGKIVRYTTGQSATPKPQQTHAGNPDVYSKVGVTRKIIGHIEPPSPKPPEKRLAPGLRWIDGGIIQCDFCRAAWREGEPERHWHDCGRLMAAHEGGEK